MRGEPAYINVHVGKNALWVRCAGIPNPRRIIIYASG